MQLGLQVHAGWTGQASRIAGACIAWWLNTTQQGRANLPPASIHALGGLPINGLWLGFINAAMHSTDLNMVPHGL